MGANDIGQGSDTVLSQMGAEALKIPLENVAFVSPDTDGSPFNWGTTASRVTFMTGRAVLGAAAEVEKQIKQQASEMLECAVEGLLPGPGGAVAARGAAGSSATPGHARERSHWFAG